MMVGLKNISREFRIYPVLNLEGWRIEVIVRPERKIQNLEQFISEPFQFALNNIISHINPLTYIEITIESDQCVLNKPVYIPWRRRAFINEEAIVRAIENVLQSNQTFLFTRNIKIKVNLVDCKRDKAVITSQKIINIQI